MTGADRLDACRDAGALLRATADHDHEAVEILLDYGDTPRDVRDPRRHPRRRLPRLQPRIHRLHMRPPPRRRTRRTMTAEHLPLTAPLELLAEQAATAQRTAGPAAGATPILTGDGTP